jgi:ElaB/YqjD/DUF883 family membrane-anchored ribosome-binding protein
MTDADGINAIIAERDELLKATADLNAMLVSSAEYHMRERHDLRAERDKLKEQRDKWCKAYEDCANEHKALVERVGVLEKALDGLVKAARAALRTSEDA